MQELHLGGVTVGKSKSKMQQRNIIDQIKLKLKGKKFHWTLYFGLNLCLVDVCTFENVLTLQKFVI